MAVDRADVCVIMIDATGGLYRAGQQRLQDTLTSQGKASVIAINKWDAVEKDGKTMQEFTKKLEVDFSFMSYAPFVFISALTGQRVDKLFEQIKYTYSAEYKTYLDRYSQRYAGICYRKSTAAVRQGQAA